MPIDYSTNHIIEAEMFLGGLLDDGVGVQEARETLKIHAAVAEEFDPGTPARYFAEAYARSDSYLALSSAENEAYRKENEQLRAMIEEGT